MSGTVRTGVMALAVALAGVALAESYSWKELASGSFGESANWTPEGVPGTTAADTAKVVFYNKRGDVTISDSAAAGARTFASFDYGENSVNRQSWVNTTFDLGGNTWNVTGDWTQYTLGTFNNVLYNPEITFADGTINVVGNMKAPRGGGEYGGRVSFVGPLTVTAANLIFGGNGTTVVISNGAHLVTAGTLAFPDYCYATYFANGCCGRMLVEGAGTSVSCKEFRVCPPGGQYYGDSRVCVTNGAAVNVSGVLHVGSAGDAATALSLSNVFTVAKGGTVNVSLQSKGYGLFLGSKGSFNEFNVIGEGAVLAITNAQWYVGNNALSTSNVLRVAKGGKMLVSAPVGVGYDPVSGFLGYGVGQRIVVEDGGSIEFSSGKDASGNKQLLGLRIGHGDTASGHQLFIGHNGYVGLEGNPSANGDHRLRTYIGCNFNAYGSIFSKGGSDCEMVVSNGTYNGWSSDCMISLGSPADDVRAKLRIMGDDAKVLAISCDMGRGSVIEFTPGPNGFKNIPLRMGRNFQWLNNVEQMAPGTEPKVVVDVKDWKPVAHKADIELVRAAGEITTWNWEAGTNVLKTVVAKAEIRNAREGERWTVYATDDLKHIRLSFKRDRGLAIVIR